MSEHILSELEQREYNCLICEIALDPQADHAVVELDSFSTGPGFRAALVCQDCEPGLAELMAECGGAPR